MEWASDDMTETDDSDYDDPMDRANQLYVDNYNYDLSEGMTPMTYTPPLRRNRPRRYEVRKTKEADIVETVSVTGDRDFQADMGSPESEPMAQPKTVVDENFQDVSDNSDDRGGRPRTGNDQNIFSDEDSVFFDRPVAGSPTVGDWLDGPSIINGIDVGCMVIEELREMANDEANFSVDSDPSPVKRIARELRRAWAENNAKPVEERESCQVPGCQCNGRADYMDWNSDDMTETDYSHCEDYSDYEETEADIMESISGEIDEEFLTDEALSNSESVSVKTVIDKDIWTVSNKTDNRGGRMMTGSDEDITSVDISKMINRPVTGSLLTCAGTNTDSPSGIYENNDKQPVTESLTARESDTEEPLVMTVSTVTMALSELSTSVCDDTDTGDIPVYNEYSIPDRRRPVKVLPDVNTQVVKSDNNWNSRDCCFGMCNKTDSVDRSGICLRWDFLRWLVWGYRASCLTAIVIKDGSHGIDLYTEESGVYTSGLGLLGDPMTPSDVIPVYAMMNGNFKGGLNNVMLKNKGSVDGRYDQRCVDNRHWPETRASLCDNPIRVKGRFGCSDSPVRDVDWSDGRSVGVSPVGDVRIEYIGDAFSQGQSTDAAPLTELIDFYTFLQTYSDCATGFTSIWTFCITVQDNISGEEFTRRGSDNSVCQTMDGAALVDDRSVPSYVYHGMPPKR